MQRTGAFFFLIVIFPCVLDGTEARPPNFVLIVCDDLGYSDIGAFGSKNHRTPRIDRMAREGMKLTSFYATSSVCTPSRASLMTGCYPKRVSLHENESGQWVLFPGNHRGLNPEEITIAEILKTQGYATAIVGKWHLGDQPEFLPTRHGFDSYFGIPYSNDMGKLDRPADIKLPPTPLLRDETVVEVEPDQRYLTKRYTEEAIGFIERNQARPFFLYLPHSMPHWPQYATKAFAGQSANGVWGDAVEEIDWSTGQILDCLKRVGIDDDTLVLFMSDNGGAIHRGAVNTPLRGGKGTTWEGGQRVCCVARWPGKIAPGSVCDEITVNFDLLPTFAKLAGGAAPTDRFVDGRDIWPLLAGEVTRGPHDRFFYFFRGALEAVRSGKWKLFVRRRKKKEFPRFQEPELYDLSDDVGESRNVAKEHPAVVARLQKDLSEMRQDLGDTGGYAARNAREPGFVADPGTLTADAPDGLRLTDVFIEGDGGYHTFRIPSLLVTQKGDLLAICEGRKTDRKDHGDVDLVTRRSEDNGATWSDLQLLYEEGGDEKITMGNPCPVLDRTTGVIWLPFCRDNDDVLITSSADGGKTWAAPREITQDVKLDGWGWYATGPGAGIQLTRGKHNGRLVIPCDHREKKDGEWIKTSNVFYSDDHGRSWQLGGSVADYTDECQVVELNDGRLMINMRNYWGREGGKAGLGGMRAVALSDDGGESWGELKFDETLVEPICQASFIKHSHDTFLQAPLLFSNPASSKERLRLTVRLSRDEGQSWPISRVLYHGPAAYSCMAVLPDRSIGCLFEAGDEHPYERIRFARFALPWLEQ